MMRTTRRIIKDSKNNNEINNNLAVYIGSFDPIHDGHIYVIKRALMDFKYLYVVIAQNDFKNKNDFIKNKQKIIDMIKVNNLDDRVNVLINNSLTVDFLNSFRIFNVVRGYRNFVDLRYEKKLYKQYNNKNLIFFIYKSDRTNKNIRNHYKNN